LLENEKARRARGASGLGLRLLVAQDGKLHSPRPVAIEHIVTTR
jgi:hypothetical protein